MNLEILEYFQYVAKYNNITKAAKHFLISQSTLSRHIMMLEDEIGCKLFERNNKKLELTEAGRVLYNESDLLIRHLKTIIDQVHQADQGRSGILRITSPGQLSATLSSALTLFHDRHPSTKLIVESYNFNEIYAAVQHGVYDIGFTYSFAIPTDPDEGLNKIYLESDTFSLAVSSALFKNPTRDDLPEIINKLPLILPSYIEPPFMKLIIHELQKYSKNQKISPIYVNTTESVMLEASLGLGFGIVPTALSKSKDGNDNIAFVEIDDFAARSTIVMFYKDQESSELIRSFVNIVKSLVS